MSDPLSVAASIAGLLTLAGKITTVIVDLTSKSKAAPKDIQYVRTSIETIRAVLLQLQMLLLGRARVDRQRTSLILVEQVVITLSACVSTFSELDVFVDTLNTDQSMGLLDRIRWATKASTIKELLDRLEAHKASLTLMTTILTWYVYLRHRASRANSQHSDSTYQAEDAVDQLADKIQQVLNNHQVLAQRLLSIEIGMNLDKALTTIPGNVPERTSIDSTRVQRNQMGFAFEEVLESSWVYKRAARHGEDGAFSVISAAGRTASWSMLSGLSLSEISFIAVLALPVYEHDISNSDAYQFGEYDEKVALLHESEVVPKTAKQKAVGRSGFSERLSRIAAGINYRRRSDNTKDSSDLQTQPAVFGQALKDSIIYANVAISLIDDAGVPYIYGYVPVIIAKTGVFIKEKGWSCHDFARVSLK